MEVEVVVIPQHLQTHQLVEQVFQVVQAEEQEVEVDLITQVDQEILHLYLLLKEIMVQILQQVHHQTKQVEAEVVLLKLDRLLVVLHQMVVEVVQVQQLL